MSLIVALTASNSLRRSAMSSGVRFFMSEYRSFQSASSLQRSGDCTVVRGPGALSSTRRASSSVCAWDSTSNGFPAELPSGKSLKTNPGRPQAGVGRLRLGLHVERLPRRIAERKVTEDEPRHAAVLDDVLRAPHDHGREAVRFEV